MNVSAVGRWVKGHQDDQRRLDELDWWGRMNKIMGMNQRSKAHEGWFPCENIRTHVENRKTTSVKRTNVKKQLLLMSTG